MTDMDGDMGLRAALERLIAANRALRAILPVQKDEAVENEWANALVAASKALAATSSAAPELDAAWHEAEAALAAPPPNRIGARWHIGRVLRTAPAFEEQWWAEAQRATGGNYDAFNSGWHDSPAAALRALAARLAE